MKSISEEGHKNIIDNCNRYLQALLSNGNDDVPYSFKEFAMVRDGMIMGIRFTNALTMDILDKELLTYSDAVLIKYGETYK
jgi:hypothetical protein